MIEFVVEGTPRSLQSSRDGLRQWVEVVRDAARVATSEDDRFEFIDVGVFILHVCFDWDNTSGDLDNIAKPILDGLKHVSFCDDHQVKELLLRRTDIVGTKVTAITGATPLLAGRVEQALQDEGKSGFVYVLIHSDVDHARLR